VPVVVVVVVVVIVVVVVVVVLLTMYLLTWGMQEVQNESEFYRNKATRQGNAVDMVTRLRAVQPRKCGTILGRGKRFLFSRKRPDRLWAYPAFYPTKALSPGMQRRDREADPSPPSSEHNVWTCTSPSHMPVWRTHGLYLYFFTPPYLNRIYGVEGTHGMQ
jgi:hypothetical protein